MVLMAVSMLKVVISFIWPFKWESIQALNGICTLAPSFRSKEYGIHTHACIYQTTYHTVWHTIYYANEHICTQKRNEKWNQLKMKICMTTVKWCHNTMNMNFIIMFWYINVCVCICCVSLRVQTQHLIGSTQCPSFPMKSHSILPWISLERKFHGTNTYIHSINNIENKTYDAHTQIANKSPKFYTRAEFKRYA